MENIAAFLVGVIITVIVGYFLSRHLLVELKSLKKGKAINSKWHLIKQGQTTLYGDNGLNNPLLSYHLESWDSGKNWYVIDQDDNEFKIRGEVESIYPGLIARLQGFDALTEHIKRKGSLDLSVTGDLNALKAAGFTIVQIGNENCEPTHKEFKAELADNYRANGYSDYYNRIDCENIAESKCKCGGQPIYIGLKKDRSHVAISFCPECGEEFEF
ncbi:MAG: hypothetical protein PHT07_24005 [Paludibacter sp.]|nr:hypothetical protein [Paludibacter sp.]